MRMSRVVASIIYFVAFVVPFLVLEDCGGGMGVMGCGESNSFAESYASYYYNLVIGSLFSFGIPLGGYVGLIVLFTEVVVRKIQTVGSR